MRTPAPLARTRPTVELTAAGSSLFEQAKQTLQQVECAARAAQPPYMGRRRSSSLLSRVRLFTASAQRLESSMSSERSISWFPLVSVCDVDLAGTQVVVLTHWQFVSPRKHTQITGKLHRAMPDLRLEIRGVQTRVDLGISYLISHGYPNPHTMIKLWKEMAATL